MLLTNMYVIRYCPFLNRLILFLQKYELKMELHSLRLHFFIIMMPVKYGSGCSSAPPAGFPLSAERYGRLSNTLPTVAGATINGKRRFPHS